MPQTPYSQITPPTPIYGASSPKFDMGAVRCGRAEYYSTTGEMIFSVVAYFELTKTGKT